jgi:flavin reductase (DIM6/NTAB) family NADH-FMN oxidoreductase RutF
MSQTETPAFEAKKFREALGCYPTGVTVVTTMDANGDARGFTANSFTSVSLNPPLLLVCLAKTAHSHAVFNAAKSFAIHVLSEKQRDVSGLFASKAPDKFAQVQWVKGHANVPLIQGSLAMFQCATHERVDAGDHTILIGRVVDFASDSGRPLGYCRGAYVGYQDATALDAVAQQGARVGALIETPEGVVVLTDAQGAHSLPTSTRLGNPDGSTGLYQLLANLGLSASLDFVYSVYEDEQGPCVIYRGRAAALRNAVSPSSLVPIAALGQVSLSDEATTALLRRYARERSEDLYGVYVGDAVSGTVVPLGTKATTIKEQP